MKLDFPVHIVRASQPMGAILLYHGWGGTSVSYLAFAKQLADEGFDVFVPELMRHDQREPLDNPFESDVTTTYFWSVVEQSITEATEIIKQSGWNALDVIVIGVSMGGFIAHGIMARQLRSKLLLQSTVAALISKQNASSARVTADQSSKKQMYHGSMIRSV
ncbi:alpha/beta fold hydrolase [Exiguobacterium sp. SL14]|nr:alpha/beta fold hydrolase [Exiguobacterium sp. SL14]MCY1690895.1 alpha/beta fold hydrolase [Exiguobacterium sp. SL14]